MAETITADSVVTMHYTLTDDDGKVLDSSDGRDPLAYLHGHGGIVVGLENALEGHTPGDEVEVSVPPAEGYGEHNGQEPELVPKRAFGKDAPLLQVGMPIRAETSDGTPVVLWIVEDRGSRVLLDGNHPLAGKTLHFKVQIVDVRQATPEELAHGHVHGPGGHHH